jgi:hypothetical protein
MRPTVKIGRTAYGWSMLFLFIGVPLLELAAEQVFPHVDAYSKYIYLGWLIAAAIWMLPLIAFVVWAWLRPSLSLPDDLAEQDFGDGDMDPIQRRIEPHF